MKRARAEDWIELDDVVEAFEAALADSGDERLEEFLPDPRHPQFPAILSELIRVDIEYRWSQATPVNLHQYRERFPQQFADRDFVAPLAFEEFRARRQAGHLVSRDEYAARYQIDVADWPADSRPRALTDTRRSAVDDSDEGLADPTDAPARELPGRSTMEQSPALGSGDSPATGGGPASASQIQPGDSFLGFEIVGELGRGAAARVYLARQQSLANRHVVLKVTPEPTVEPDRMARLQHANIVPIYSFHQAGPLHVVCMPFLGSCMLSHWVDHLRDRPDVPVTSEEFHTTWNRLAGTTWFEKSGSVVAEAGLTGASLASRSGGHRPIDTPVPGRNRLRGRDYQETVLWLGARLADGLAHAHDQGVLHLDIKPGNILLNDDGQPMLLDFHLATASAPYSPETTAVGGTLPYMSPEQLRSLADDAPVDCRSDIYSLGVVLFELLAGQLPFPCRTGELGKVMSQMQADRERVPGLRPRNSVVTPATEAIVRRCLDPRPERRYQSVHELAEDIQRQLRNLPLQYAGNPSWRERGAKWIRRHPRITSSGAVSLAAVCLLAGLGLAYGAHEQRLARLESERYFTAFVDKAPLVRAALTIPVFESHDLEPEISDAKSLLQGLMSSPEGRVDVENEGNPTAVRAGGAAKTGVPNWRSQRSYRLLDAHDQQKLDATAGELLFMMAEALARPAPPTTRELPGGVEPGVEGLTEALACNRLAVECYPQGRIPRAVWDQQARILDRCNLPAEAAAARERVAAAVDDSSGEEPLEVLELMVEARFREAAVELSRLEQARPGDSSIWFLSGNTHLALHDWARSEASYTACLALRPEWFLAWQMRGICRLMARRDVDAHRDFEQVLRLRPGYAAATFCRGLANEGRARPLDAIADLTKAMEQGFTETRVYFQRARLYDQIGQTALAAADRAEGQRRTPRDSKSWVARGMARLASEPELALDDFREAVSLNPREYEAYRNIAYVLSERLNRPDEAIAALNRELELTADDPLAWSGRGVLLARQGKHDAARADGRAALALRRDPLVVYQVACLETLGLDAAPDREPLILALLAEALRRDPTLIRLASTDPDLGKLQGKAAFQDLLKAAQILSVAGATP